MGDRLLRYNFYFVNGKRVFHGPSAVELSDLASAREMAIVSALKLMKRPAPRRRRAWAGWKVSIVDEQGIEVLSIPFPTPCLK